MLTFVIFLKEFIYDEEIIAVPLQNSVRIKNSEIQHKTKDMIVCFYQ